jgi:SAM-dependent methyltransferase
MKCHAQVAFQRESEAHTMTSIPQLPWKDWMQRWDRQQQRYLPDREERFTAMFDVLEALFPERFVVLDLACGPGSISQRLLERFPQARGIALDYDPVLLLLGQQALGNLNGRLRWVEADLRDSSWPDRLGEAQVDAVLSTTALHWLTPSALVQLYQDLGRLIRPGGVFLNGDHLGFPSPLSSVQKVVEWTEAHRANQAEQDSAGEKWEAWWQALQRESGLETLFAERERRFIGRTHGEESTLAEFHEAALRNAGFREVGVIWQHLDNRVVLAVR